MQLDNSEELELGEVVEKMNAVEDELAEWEKEKKERKDRVLKKTAGLQEQINRLRGTLGLSKPKEPTSSLGNKPSTSSKENIIGVIPKQSSNPKKSPEAVASFIKEAESQAYVKTSPSLQESSKPELLFIEEEAPVSSNSILEGRIPIREHEQIVRNEIQKVEQYYLKIIAEKQREHEIQIAEMQANFSESISISNSNEELKTVYNKLHSTEQALIEEKRKNNGLIKSYEERLLEIQLKSHATSEKQRNLQPQFTEDQSQSTSHEMKEQINEKALESDLTLLRKELNDSRKKFIKAEEEAQKMRQALLKLKQEAVEECEKKFALQVLELQYAVSSLMRQKERVEKFGEQFQGEAVMPKCVQVGEKLEQYIKKIQDLEGEFDRISNENYSLSQQKQYLEFQLQKLCGNPHLLPKDLETELEKNEGTALQAYYEGRIKVLSELVIHWKGQTQILYERFSGALNKINEKHSSYKIDTEKGLKKLKQDYEHDIAVSRQHFHREAEKLKEANKKKEEKIAFLRKKLSKSHHPLTKPH